MTQLVTRIEEITPQWLTDTLSHHGVLTQGSVVKVECETSTPFRSVVSRLKVSYSADAPASAPNRLFFKMSNPDRRNVSPDSGREIAFYLAVAGEDDTLPIPRCYEAVWDNTTARFHALFDDLSETHFSLNPPIPPEKPH